MTELLNERLKKSRALQKWQRDCKLMGIASLSLHKEVVQLVDWWLYEKSIKHLEISDDTHHKMCYCVAEHLVDDWGRMKKDLNENDFIKSMDCLELKFLRMNYE